MTCILEMFSAGRLFFKPIPVAARSKAWVQGRLFTGIMGLKPAGGMGVCLF